MEHWTGVLLSTTPSQWRATDAFVLIGHGLWSVLPYCRAPLPVPIRPPLALEDGPRRLLSPDDQVQHSEPVQWLPDGESFRYLVDRPDVLAMLEWNPSRDIPPMERWKGDRRATGAWFDGGNHQVAHYQTPLPRAEWQRAHAVYRHWPRSVLHVDLECPVDAAYYEDALAFLTDVLHTSPSGKRCSEWMLTGPEYHTVEELVQFRRYYSRYVALCWQACPEARSLSLCWHQRRELEWKLMEAFPHPALHSLYGPSPLSPTARDRAHRLRLAFYHPRVPAPLLTETGGAGCSAAVLARTIRRLTLLTMSIVVWREFHSMCTEWISAPVRFTRAHPAATVGDSARLVALHDAIVLHRARSLRRWDLDKRHVVNGEQLVRRPPIDASLARSYPWSYALRCTHLFPKHTACPVCAEPLRRLDDTVEDWQRLRAL